MGKRKGGLTGLGLWGLMASKGQFYVMALECVLSKGGVCHVDFSSEHRCGNLGKAIDGELEVSQRTGARFFYILE